MPNVNSISPVGNDLSHERKLEIYAEHCWARALLYAEGVYSLQEAVDWLAWRAMDWRIDTDLATRISADAFEKWRDRP